MALTAERIDDILTNFVLENDELLSRASQDDPQTYEIIMGGLGILSNQFGKGQVAMPVDTEPVKEVSPDIVTPAPPPPPPADEKVDEIKTEDGEVLTLKELKASIKSLKPLAEFDDDVKVELERLEGLLQQLKKKKS